MLHRFRSYFVHHRYERYGTIVVFGLAFLAISAAVILPHIFEPPPPDSERLEAFLQKLNEAVPESESAENLGSAVAKLFDFDPNTLSDSGFAALGFTPKEVGTLRKYVAAGGSFRQKDDFGRMYFMDDARFDSIRPFLLLPEKSATRMGQASTGMPRTMRTARDTSRWSDTASYKSFSYTPTVADLNTSDTTELKNVSGIGSFYAKKIVEYREALGGYHDIGQLLELWRMTPEKVDRFADKVTIDLSEIMTLDVNRATTQKLSAHPYLTFAMANKWVTYREANGPFRDSHHLVDLGLLDEELRSKLAPYLHFE